MYPSSLLPQYRSKTESQQLHHARPFPPLALHLFNNVLRRSDPACFVACLQPDRRSTNTHPTHRQSARTPDLSLRIPGARSPIHRRAGQRLEPEFCRCMPHLFCPPSHLTHPSISQPPRTTLSFREFLAFTNLCHNVVPLLLLPLRPPAPFRLQRLRHHHRNRERPPAPYP